MHICRLFKREWCQKLVEEKKHFEKWAAENSVHVNRPTSMVRYGAILDEFGLDSFLSEFVSNLLKPVLSPLFEGEGGDSIDS